MPPPRTQLRLAIVIDRSGSMSGTPLAQATTLAQGQPWLAAKLAHLRELVERDAEMAAKEVSYSANRMNVRLAAAMPAPFMDDETASEAVPAYLRRKTGEGRGRMGSRGRQGRGLGGDRAVTWRCGNGTPFVSHC